LHLKKIKISNIRGFGEGEQALDLDLTRPDGSLAGWTVFAGPNGSGKTTILQAIATAIAGHDRFHALVRDHAGWIRQGVQRSMAASTALDICWDPVEDPFMGGAPEDVRKKIREDGLLKVLLTVPNPRAGDDPKPFMIQVEALTIGMIAGLSGWFAVGYGAFRRLVSASGENPVDLHDRVESFKGLFSEREDFLATTIWLKDIHTRRLENKPEAHGVLENLLKLLNEGLLPHGSKVIDVDSDGLWVEQDGIKLLLHQLGSGYRVVAAFVIDLVMRLRSAFGDKFRFEQRDGKTIIPHTGVVLVDEMEEHLHPSWQQKIGFWLTEHFPGLQFLVTTHSPFVCQAASPNGLIRLGAPGEGFAAKQFKESDEVYKRVVAGGIDESVISELFGLAHPHSHKAEQLRDKVADLEAKLLDEEILTPEEDKQLEALKAQLPSTPSVAVERALRRLDVSR
jgi:energy-coupling factor transporter ATP-binding protein EcfA2